jgi:hypothetical protein
LRGTRECVQQLFEAKGLHVGRHRWSDEKLFDQAKIFLQLLTKRKDVSNKDVWRMVCLIYPVKANLFRTVTNSAGTAVSEFCPKCPALYEALGEGEILVHKGIFDNNNATLREEFFKKGGFMNVLWPSLMGQLKY